MSTKSVQGDLKSFSIFDVTQSLLMGRKTAVVTVQCGTKRGYIHFRDGQIVAATDDALATGERAAMNVFSWTGGTFAIDFDRAPDPPNVKVPTDQLLLEVARNLDEIRRDKGIDEESAAGAAEVEGTLRDRVQDRLQRELTGIFRRVAANASPTRARYTRNAFDALLQALLDLDGTALFIRPGQRPRIKTATGFSTLKEEAVSSSEIEGFLACVLSEGAAVELRERQCASTAFHAPHHGPFRVHVVCEHGTLLLTITPAGKALPALDRICPGVAELRLLREGREGLIVIAGPMGSGKTAFAGALVQEHMNLHDAFAVMFDSGSSWGFAGERGYCVRRENPALPATLHAAVRGAVEQGPDILGILGADTREAMTLALAAAGSRRLVLFGIETQSPPETLKRLARLARTADGDPLTETLAERLRAVVDLAPRAPDGALRATLRVITRECAGHIRAGDFEALRPGPAAQRVNTGMPPPLPVMTR